MNYSGSSVAKPSWTSRESLEICIYTLLLNAVLSFLLVALLQSVSSSLGVQILGFPLGTAILGASEALLGIPLLVYSRRLGIKRFQLGIRTGTSLEVLVDVVFGIMIGLAMVPVSLAATALNTLVLGPQPGAEYIKESFTASSLLDVLLLLFVIVFVVAPFEEVIARGFIQSGFERSVGEYKGIILASLLFSLMHLNLWSTFPLLLLGILLGFVFRLRHGRILAPITSHAVYMMCLIATASY